VAEEDDGANDDIGRFGNEIRLEAPNLPTNIRTRTELRLEALDLPTKPECRQESSTPTPHRRAPRVNSKLADRQGLTSRCQENEVLRIKPAPGSAGLRLSSSRRSRGLYTGGGLRNSGSPPHGETGGYVVWTTTRSSDDSRGKGTGWGPGLRRWGGVAPGKRGA
jgi:hypothetical protein